VTDETVVVLSAVTAVAGAVGAWLSFGAGVMDWRARRRKAKAAAATALPPAAPQALSPAVSLTVRHPLKGSLPVPVPAFVDRDAPLQDAMQRVGGGREPVLVIEGPSGIGKSATANELAHRLQAGATTGTFDLSEHRFIWVDGHDGCTTLAEIGRSLRIETDDVSVAMAPPQARLNRLLTHLSEHKTALVLDNLRLTDDADSRELRDLLRALPDGSLVIAAVNGPDGLDAYRVPLEELRLEDVERLVARQVERLKLQPAEQFDAAFARRLYAIVGGHPGVITWFLLGYKNSGETLAERLAALERGQDLETLFEPIWGNLNAESRAILVACDGLGGRATADQLAIACDLPRETARAQVASLVRENLLTSASVAGRSVLVCPQAFALFAFGQTEPGQRAAQFLRLARSYVERFRRDPENARDVLVEVDAIRALFKGLDREILDALDPEPLERALQDLFQATLDLLLTLGLLDDRLAAAEAAYASAIRTQRFCSASLAAHVVAGTRAFRGELETAREAVALGWEAADACGSPAERARQKYTEGFVLYRSGDAAGALAAVTDAEQEARAGDDPETVVNILDLQAAAFLHVGELDACTAAATRCLKVCEEMRWQRAKAFPLRFLAEVAVHRGASDEASGLLDRARRIARRYDDQRQSARVSLTSARMFLLDGDLDEAEPCAEHALKEAQRLGLPPEEREAWALLEAVRLARRSPTALERYRRERPLRLTDAPVAGD